MKHHSDPAQLSSLLNVSRRRFLGDVTTGLAGVGLMQMLTKQAFADDPAWKPGVGLSHHTPKAKRVLQIFCPGAASHMDLWEYKPALEKYHGKPLPGEENFRSFQGPEWKSHEKPLGIPPLWRDRKNDQRHAASHGPACR